MCKECAFVDYIELLLRKRMEQHIKKGSIVLKLIEKIKGPTENNQLIDFVCTFICTETSKSSVTFLSQ